MSSKPRLTHAELAAARERQDWGLLWEQAIPLAKLAVRRLMQKGSLDPHYASEDLMQDALLAAGLAVRKWQPEKGAFSTWVMVCARGAALSSMAADMSGMIGGRNAYVPIVSLHHPASTFDIRDSGSAEEDCDERVETKVQYESCPAGFADPEEELMKQDASAQVDELIGRVVSPQDRKMVERVYGIGRPRETIAQYAIRERLALRTVKYRLGRVLSELALSS